MEKIIKRTGFSPIVFVLLGLALVFISYLLAGGQDRLMPMYGFPEPAFGCNFDDVGVISTIEPPELSRGYRQSELLWCYPPQDYPFYALAILGIIISGWALVISGKEKSLNAISAFTVALIMILTGGRIFKLEIVFLGSRDPPDIFNSLALVLVIMGLLVGIFGVVSVVVGAIKAIRYRLS